jgi:hypothetical protein
MCTITTASPARKPGSRKPRPKPTRTYDLLLPPSANGMPGFLRITMTDGNRVLPVDYFLSRLPSDFGTAFRLQKILGEHDAYDVLLGPDGLFSCECKGHLRHGTACKHAATLADLRREGKL